MIRATTERPIAILGGGIAGLTAAVWLHRQRIPFVLFEGAPAVAGLMRSERDEEGFTYDCGVHFVTNRLVAAVGRSTRCQPMRRYGEAVHLDGKTYAYPWGLMRSPKYLVSAAIERVTQFGRARPTTAREQYRAEYGWRLAEEIAAPLTEAWSGLGADHLAAAVGQKFKTSLPRMLMLRAAARMTGRVIGIGYASTITESTNSWHVYPDGGVGAICQDMASEVADSIRLNCRVESIEVRDDRVTAIVAQGERIEVAGAISTAPVHALAKLVQGTDALQPYRDFRYRAMVFINLKLRGESGLKEVVTWFPDRSFPFFRVSDIGMGLPFLVPDGKAQVTCDIGCQVGDDVWKASDEELAERCLGGLERLVPDVRARCFGSRVVRVPLAYPIFDLAYEPARQRWLQGTGVEGLLSIGRNGEFAHILMEDVYWRTRWKLAEWVRGMNAA